jgi:hypothetical protein
VLQAEVMAHGNELCYDQRAIGGQAAKRNRRALDEEDKKRDMPMNEIDLKGRRLFPPRGQ